MVLEVQELIKSKDMPIDINDENKSAPETPSKKNKPTTPLLDNFGKDLTKLATEGKLEAVIGRETEIDRVIQILSRKKKNNPVLVGEPGVGKSAIAEGLAKKIAEKKTSIVLHNKRIVTLDISSIVAGTKYRGQFEERMKAIMEEIEENPNVILFIDELHTIIGAGNSTGSLDVSNMLKPALARGIIQIIGATTIDEYKKSIEKDGAMERRFQKVLIEEPSTTQTKEILRQIKPLYEDFHNVIYDEDAIEAAVDFSDRYITTRFQPDKSIDILDEVGSRLHLDNLKMPAGLEDLEKKALQLREDKNSVVKMQDYERAAKLRDEELKLLERIETEKANWHRDQKMNKIKVTSDDVAKVVSKMVGIPVTKITESEGTRLLAMDEEIKKRVVGQDDAVVKVCQAIQRNRTGLSNPRKPIASFLFLGSTGVGKTELSKALAEVMFNDESALIKLDMSEYMEPHSVAKLIGSPPGYVGYEEGGQLTEKIRIKPYSVLLLDEIEKAHPTITNILLQILDEGKLTDAQGKTVNFKNTIIIMTSNAGTKELFENKPMGFGTKSSAANDAHTKSIIDKALGKIFRKETLGRIDEQIIFRSPDQNDIISITEIHLDNFFKQVKELGYKVKYTKELKNFIAQEGYSEEFGVRPIHRTITTYIQNTIAKNILEKNILAGDLFTVDYDSEKNEVIIVKGK